MSEQTAANTTAAKRDDGGPAFPSEQHETQQGTWNQTFQPGMSLRDAFAMAALQGMLAGNWEFSREEYAEIAYRLADGMLTERAKQ